MARREDERDSPQAPFKLTKSPNEPTKAELRQQMEKLLPDSASFESFCIDHFPEVYRRYTRGMDRVEQTNLLLQQADPQDLARRLQELKNAQIVNQTVDEASAQMGTIERIPSRLPRDSEVTEFLDLHRKDCQDTELISGFAGRVRELDQLNAWWANQSGPAYLLIIAPPGLGKSALLVRWWEQLMARQAETTNRRIVFCPLSLRQGIDREEDYLARMIATLSPMRTQSANVEEASTPIKRRQAVRELLRIPMENGQQILFIVDGIDEAVDLNLSPGPFPVQLGQGIKVVISMREGTDDASVVGWRRRLGLDRADRAQVMQLGLLSPDEIGALVAKRPDSSPLERVKLAESLYRLTEGDPLVLRLYLEHFKDLAASGRKLSTESLHTLGQGIEGVFQQWWYEQQRAWGTSKPYAEPVTREILSLLASARGPLFRRDLEALIPENRLPDAFALTDILRPLSRWIFGDGVQRGFAFSHPRLTDFFRLPMREDAQRQYRVRLSDYCQKVASDLIAGNIAPETISEYVLRCYGVHLDDAQAGAQDYLRLASEPWRKAWLVRTQDYLGFSVDIQRAWAASERAARMRTACNASEQAAWQGLALRCALYQTSINTILLRVPAYLIRSAVRQGCWTMDRACKYVQSNLKAEDRAQAYFELAALQKELGSSNEHLWNEALSAARQIRDQGARAEHLTEIFADLPAAMQDLRAEILYAEIRRLKVDDDNLTQALINYLPYLKDDEKTAASQWIRKKLPELLRQEDRLNSAALAIAKMPPSFAAEQTRDLLSQVRGVPFYRCQLHALLPTLAQEKDQLLAYGEANRIDHPAMQAEAFCNLAHAPHFPEHLRLSAFRNSLKALSTYLQDPNRYPEPMQPMGDDMEILPTAFRKTMTIFQQNMAKAMSCVRAGHVLYNLSIWLPDQLLPELAPIAELASKGKAALIEIVHAANLRTQARLPNPPWDDIFAKLQGMPTERRRGCLVALADWLPAEQIPKALSFCDEISDKAAQSRALVTLSEQGPSAEVLVRVLDSLAGGPDSYAEQRRLLQSVPEAARATIRDAVARAARALPNGITQTKELIALLPFLDGEKQEIAQQAAMALLDEAAIQPPSDLVSALGDLLPHVSPQSAVYVQLIAMALAVSKRVEDDWTFDLDKLLPFFSELQREEIRKHAQSSKPEVRASTLASLVAYASEAEDQRLAIASEALSAIEAIPIGQLMDRLAALRKLAPSLPKCLLRRARRIALSLRRASSKKLQEFSMAVAGLTALYEHAEAEDRTSLLHDILRASNEVKGVEAERALFETLALLPDGKERKSKIARALRLLIDRPELKTNSLDDFSQDTLRYAAVKDLAPLLDTAQKDKLLDALLKTKSAGVAGAFEALIPHLGPAALARLRSSLPAFGTYRIRTIWKAIATATAQSSASIESRQELLCEILRDISDGSRPELLRQMDALAPLLGGTAAPASADAAVRAVLDVCAAWT